MLSTALARTLTEDERDAIENQRDAVDAAWRAYAIAAEAETWYRDGRHHAAKVRAKATAWANYVAASKVTS